ncbi:MAG: hypothetical protein K2X49_14400 [Acetobacteraceae bacterium]|nr:hypothetical protein [Acetobacteraceae bacterium]
MVEVGELRLGHLEDGGDGAGDARRAGLASAAAFHADHLDELAAAGDEFGQRLCLGSRSVEASMPAKTGPEGGCSMTRPCECGLARRRPRRPFAFPEGTTDGAAGSATGSITPGASGLPSAASRASSSPAGN